MHHHKFVPKWLESFFRSKKRHIVILKLVLGTILIIIGIVGLFLPILQGVLLIFLGLLLIGVKKRQMKRWWKKITSWI